MKSGNIYVHVSTFHSLDMQLRDEYELNRGTNKLVNHNGKIETNEVKQMSFSTTDYDPPV